MKNKTKTIITNIIIVLMLVVLSSVTLSFNSTFVANYANNNVIYNGNRNSNKVTLMLNVYSGTEYIDDILQTLDEYGVKTTFFVGGVWVEKNLNTFQSIIEHGHEIGNHGYLHLDHDKLSYNQNVEEILTCNNLVRVYTGYSMRLFAPPSGAYNNATVEAATNLGYSTIMWSKDTIDWRDHDTSLIYKRATNNVMGGDLILMHPTKNTAEALKAILEYYKINNLTATTVSDNLSIE